MDVDLRTSTVTLAGRRFPACCVICPDVEGSTDTEWDRMLGGIWEIAGTKIPGGPTFCVMVPCENGILVQLEWKVNDPTACHLQIDSRTCELVQQNRDILWLPRLVGVRSGRLVTPPHGKSDASVWYWTNAEPEWAAEWITRLSSMSYTEVAGPAVKLISLAEAYQLDKEAWRLAHPDAG